MALVEQERFFTGHLRYTSEHSLGFYAQRKDLNAVLPRAGFGSG